MDSVPERPLARSVGAAGVVLALFSIVTAATVTPVSRAQQLGFDECPSSSGLEVVRRVALPGKAGFPLLINGTLWITIQSATATGHGHWLDRLRVWSSAQFPGACRHVEAGVRLRISVDHR